MTDVPKPRTIEDLTAENATLTADNRRLQGEVQRLTKELEAARQPANTATAAVQTEVTGTRTQLGLRTGEQEPTTRRIIPVPNVDTSNSYADFYSNTEKYPLNLDPFEATSVEQLMRGDPRFVRLFQDECLLFAITADRESFLNEFTGERAANGYLIGVDGQETAFLPSQQVTAGLNAVKRNALRKYNSGTTPIDVPSERKF